MRREWPALLFALAYPTLLAWFYFVLLAGGGAEGKANPVQQAAYATGKALQFALPVLLCWWFDACLPRPGRPRFDRLRTGVAFGLLVVAGMFALYRNAKREGVRL